MRTRGPWHGKGSWIANAMHLHRGRAIRIDNRPSLPSNWPDEVILGCSLRKEGTHPNEALTPLQLGPDWKGRTLGQARNPLTLVGFHHKCLGAAKARLTPLQDPGPKYWTSMAHA
mmetsp:Transcript_24157/g.43579  ORF Transcript_24157/g.43579 Transcript_24157/m.43579 type:complete len:115 (+) Transcript_24157:738-1082(+)